MRGIVIGGWIGFLACGPVGSEAPHAPQSALPSEPSILGEPEEPRTDASVDPIAPRRAADPPDRAAIPNESEVPEKPWPDHWEARILAVQPTVAEAAAEYRVDPFLINGLIWVESKFNRKARNRSGARGLMQLMPKTAQSLGRSLGRRAHVYDADFNIHAGTYYMSRLLEQFDGDARLALAAYVGGPSRVRGWVDTMQPFPGEVERFIAKVQDARAVFFGLGWPAH